MRLRVLDTGPSTARWNVAASAALLESVDESGVAVLRFHRYPNSCILGRFQDVEAELDLVDCGAEGVAVARRMTGGGAVVMGPGVLAFDVVVPGRSAMLTAVPERVGTALLAALADLGLMAHRPTAGSVAIDGLKVSGSAGRLARNAMLHQATLILDLTEAAPLRLLRRRTEAGKPTADPRHRVTDLGTALHRHVIPGLMGGESPEPIDADTGVPDGTSRRRPSDRQRVWVPGSPAAPWNDRLMDRLARHIAEAFGLEPRTDTMSDAENARAAAIFADTVGRDDFVLAGDVERRAA